MNHMTRHLPGGRRRREGGLTLVEVLVALAIGVLLTAGAIQIFVSSKQAFRSTQALSRVQEGGRYALHFLAKDIRGASFYGCAQDAEVNNVVQDSATPPAFDFDGDPIEGTEGGANPDTLTMRMATTNQNIAVSQQMPSTAANLFLTNVTGIEEGDIMIITDCNSADIFTVTGVNANNANLQHNSGSNPGFSHGNTTQEFSKSYGTDATAYSISERSYAVVNNVLQRTINGTTSDLVEEVEDLQFEYGVDPDEDREVDTYVTADLIDGATLQWEDVVAIRTSVTVRSEEQNVAEDDGAGDGRMRKTFTRTIGVRNRLE